MYYPFGNSFADASGSSTQPYKYNGKELDARNGLSIYDYGARWKSPIKFEIPFMTTNQLPSYNKAWILIEKWFWCKANDWREFMKNK